MAKYGVATYGVDLYGEVPTIPFGGSTASIIISASGTGISIRQGGSGASVTINAEGSGTTIRSGSSQAEIIVSTEGSGLKISSGGSSALVFINSQGNGLRFASSGSTASIVVSAEGDGVKQEVYIIATVSANKNISFSKKLFAMQDEKVLALVNVDSSLYASGLYAQIDALLPNGIIESKGLYDYSQLAFYVLFGDGDNILSSDGNIKLQISFVKYGNDGTTKIVSKRTKTISKKILSSIMK